MRILQLFGGVIRHGGEEMFVLNCLKNFTDSDIVFDCLVIEDCDNDDFRKTVAANGGSLYELNIPLHATRFINHIYKPVCRFFKRHSYDVVHIHSSSIAAIAVLAAAADRAGTPVVIVHSHSTGKADSLEHKAFRFLASLSMRSHVDVYCACSKEAARWKFEPKYAEKANIIQNGIDVERFRFKPAARERIRAELGIPADSFVIGHVGRLCKLKNQEFLLNVFELMSKDSDARLILVGDGEEGENLRAAVAEKGLSERVSFTGNVSNVEEYMSAMDAFAFPSEYEGLGIVAVEAQCSGLYTVASTGVPADVNVSGKVEFIDVSADEASYRRWADKLSSFRGLPRLDGAAAVRQAGYDIRDTVKRLKEIYTARNFLGII